MTYRNTQVTFDANPANACGECALPDNRRHTVSARRQLPDRDRHLGVEGRYAILNL
jgi:hypothetical protein